jgi:hypothetical protein
VNGRSILIRHGWHIPRLVGYADLADVEGFAAAIRGALADAYVAGQQHARTEVERIVDACTDDDSVNGADLVGGNDATDGLMEWLTR